MVDAQLEPFLSFSSRSLLQPQCSSSSSWMFNMFYAIKSTEGYGGFRVTGRQVGCLDAAVNPGICTWIRTNAASPLISLNAILHITAAL